jgi:hypothetical protein
LLDSLLALLFEEPCPLVTHTDFLAYIPSLGEKKKVDRARFADLRSKAAGDPRGMAPLVAGLSPRRGAVSNANVGGEKALLFPPKKAKGENGRGFDGTTPSPLEKKTRLPRRGGGFERLLLLRND